MSEGNTRYLLEVMVIPERTTSGQKYVSAIARKLGNALNEYGQTPHAQAILEYCENHIDTMEGFIEDNFLQLEIEAVDYNPEKDKPNGMLNGIEACDRGKVRVMLYPGDKIDVSQFKLPEATHNMIIRFDKGSVPFMAVEPHANTPNFYQPVADDTIASLHIEALLVDAGMCHFIGISAAALHHDDEQNISHEKVQFLLDLVNSGDVDNCELSEKGNRLVKFVQSKLSNDTPYISFLSIFTVAPFECFKKDLIKDEFDELFGDYCTLWLKFQRWYYQKHGRFFNKGNCTKETVMELFDRNKYQGQISPETAQLEIQKKFDEKLPSSKILGVRGLYAFIILRNVPDSGALKKVSDSLFPRQIHQSTWVIKPWNQLSDFDKIKGFIEVVPFILDIPNE